MIKKRFFVIRSTRIRSPPGCFFRRGCAVGATGSWHGCRLQGLYNLNPDAVGAFLDAETDGGMQRMREMMLQCPDRPVRVAMKELYLHLFGILAESEGDRCV